MYDVCRRCIIFSAQTDKKKQQPSTHSRYQLQLGIWQKEVRTLSLWHKS